MAHTVCDKTKLLNRVSRIIGQLKAVQRGIEAEEDCTAIMQMTASSRGALNSFLAELVEGHIRYHMSDPDRRPASKKARAAQELIDVVKSYVK
jgi:DNA-binding FrmR family transcriptional regulator